MSSETQAEWPTPVDPVAMLGVMKDDQAVRAVAEEAKSKLKRVIESLKG